MSFIALKNVVKEYKVNKECFKALDIESLEIEHGDFALILGPSGSGKSTLLNILGGMDTPTSGSVLVDGSDISKYSAKELTKYRSSAVGFVFQFYNLIGNLTALENILISSKNVSSVEAMDALKMLGVDSKANAFPSSMSGGEAQRVAIARATVKNPSILLCDEPTGALDTKNGIAVMENLKKLCDTKGQTVVVVTHNPDLKKYATRIITLCDGKALGE